MTDTSIQWTDCTVNPIRFGAGHYCQKISPGCAHCYASRMQPRFGNPEFGGAGSALPPAGRLEDDGLWLDRAQLEKVLLWLDRARLEKVLRRKKPSRIFWADMTDLFGKWVPDEWIDQCFAVMALTPQHTHQVLTKRPERTRQYIESRSRPSQAAALDMAARRIGRTLEFEGRQLYGWPLRNVWLGVSVEDQQRADERIPLLLQTPAAVRFLSCEPLLGPVDLTHYLPRTPKASCEPEMLQFYNAHCALHWVIAGGESGPGARPCELAWLRSIVAQCRDAGVACFVKQLGSRPFGEGWPCGMPLRDRKGGDPEEWPEDLRVREWPARGATT